MSLKRKKEKKRGGGGGYFITSHLSHLLHMPMDLYCAVEYQKLRFVTLHIPSNRNDAIGYVPSRRLYAIGLTSDTTGICTRSVISRGYRNVKVWTVMRRGKSKNKTKTHNLRQQQMCYV